MQQLTEYVYGDGDDRMTMNMDNSHHEDVGSIHDGDIDDDDGR